MHSSLYLSPEPSDPPHNVTATVMSSTEIMVSWEEVPAINQNGEITTYEIQYAPLETFERQISTDTVNTSGSESGSGSGSGSVLMMVSTGLEEYVEYNISVRAYTSAGPGPYSDPVTERTSEDSKQQILRMVCLFSFDSSNVNFLSNSSSFWFPNESECCHSVIK